MIHDFMTNYKIEHRNFIKPGIGESTRVLLRRVPKILFIQDMESKVVKHLILLAKQKDVSVIEIPDLPYQAIAIIKDID
jgi:ribosomal protein L7Ae-like RNA K-turn-binding protein